MNNYVMTGTFIVLIALTFYSIGVITEQRGKKVTRKVLTFLTLGILADIIATTFMIMGSSKGMLSLHGFIGYSSLSGMLVDNILLWRIRYKMGINAEVPRFEHLWSRYAYIWWVAAFITGGLLVAIR